MQKVCWSRAAGPQPLVPHLSSSNGLHPLHSVNSKDLRYSKGPWWDPTACHFCSPSMWYMLWVFRLGQNGIWQTYGPCGAIALGPSLQRGGIIRGYKTLDGDMRGAFVPHHWLGDLESGSLHGVTMCDSWLQDQLIVMINSCFPCGRPTFWPAFRYV